MKRFSVIALSLLCLIQILIPLGMIYNKYDILKNGQEVKFHVVPIDPYDPFRGRYVAINVENFLTNYDGRYGIVEVDEDGFGRIYTVSKTKPKDKLYVKSKKKNFFNMPIDRYYMDEKLAPEADRLNFDENNKAYVVARIKNGNVVLSSLFVNDVPIEDYIIHKKGK